MRALLQKIRRAFSSGNFITHYLSCRGFRISVSLLLSLILNVLYLTFNLVSGIIYSSSSFVAVAIYYALHIRIRYTILNSTYEKCDGEAALLTIRRGGVLLLIADALITPMLVLGALGGRSEQYGPLVLIFLAAYAAYTLVSAAAGIFVSKREKLAVRRAAYSVRLASGIVSGYNLLSAMLSTAPDAENSKIFIAALGAAVSLSVLLLSLSMIFSSATAERSL